MLEAFFDKVYVINLPNRRDRRMAIVQKMARIGLDFTFFSAVNGYAEECKAEFENYASQPIGGAGSHELEVKYDRKLIKSAGAWGYLKTYENLILDAQRNGYKRILCFDDDIVFSRNFEDQISEFFKAIDDDWKLIYLGATQHVWNMPTSHFYPDKTIAEYQPDQPHYHPSVTDGSFAIGIDSSIYEMLLEETRRFNAPFDSGPLRAVNQKYPGDCYVAQPNLVVADVSESDISEDRNQFELAEKVKWDMELYDFPFKEDLVSVIMPVFNGAETIEASIRSIQNQSYRNLEIIVGNDGSTDDTAAIVRGLAKNDERIKLLDFSENRGCYFVRNDALRVARGKYIAIQDADDISLSTRIEQQVVPLITGKALFVISRIYRSRCDISELTSGSDTELIKIVESRRIKNSQGKYEYRDRAILGFNSSIFHRSLFEEIGLFWENRFASDAEYCERILFEKADVRMSETENIHTFLMECEPIPGLFERLDDVLVISASMGETNITNKYKSEQKKAFEQQWRKNFIQSSYEYPRFTKEELQLNSDPREDENLDVRLEAMKKIYETRFAAKDQIISASRKRIQNLENDIAWYSRTYDHLPKWYLKIGGIFRRFNPWK